MTNHNFLESAGFHEAQSRWCVLLEELRAPKSDSE